MRFPQLLLAAALSRFQDRREQYLAEHACRKYSGRVGRSADAKALDPQAVTLAVAAHIRHQETDYDQLLLDQVDRADARHRVRQAVADTLEAWRGKDQRPPRFRGTLDEETAGRAAPYREGCRSAPLGSSIAGPGDASKRW